MKEGFKASFEKKAFIMNFGSKLIRKGFKSLLTGTKTLGMKAIKNPMATAGAALTASEVGRVGGQVKSQMGTPSTMITPQFFTRK